MNQQLIATLRLVCSNNVPNIPNINGGRNGGRKPGNQTEDTKQAG